MGAQGSQSGLCIRKEISWGVLAIGQYQSLNFVSEDLAFNQKNNESKSVRPDRQTSDLIPISVDCGGNIVFEFRARDLDGVLPGAFWSQDWNRVDGATNTGKITAGATAADLNFTFAIESGTGLGGTITFGSAVVHNIQRYQHIVVNNVNGDAANHGIMFVKNVVGQVITVNKPLVNEIVQADTFIVGDIIRNGVIRSSYSIERANNDISEFAVYTGSVPNVLTFGIESGSEIKATLSFVSKDEVLDTDSVSDPASTTLLTTPVMSTAFSVGQVAVDNTVLSSCLIQKVDVSLNQKAEGRPGVGSLSSCEVVGRAIAVTGNIVLYFNDRTYYSKYRNSEFFGLTIPMVDTYGDMYIIYMPKVKFVTAKKNTTAKDADVNLDTTYMALVGVEGYTIQITRALGSGIVFNGTLLS